MKKGMKKINTIEERRSVVLPCGQLGGGVCGDCIYMDNYDRDKWGQCYCGKRGHYYPAGSSACNYFEP